jgi:hypothetical protein
MNGRFSAPLYMTLETIAPLSDDRIMPTAPLVWPRGLELRSRSSRTKRTGTLATPVRVRRAAKAVVLLCDWSGSIRKGGKLRLEEIIARGERSFRGRFD